MAPTLVDVPAPAWASLRPWFAPPQPGPQVFEHALRTGLGGPGATPWPRIIAELPDTGPVPAPAGVRLLGPPDAGLLAAIDPADAWIHDTWGGPAGLAAAEVARAVVVDGRAVSVAVPFHMGGRHEDIGVVTASAHRGRGHSTACAAAVVADIRARGRRPSWSTSPDNTASLAVAARLGFVRHRDDVLYAVGVPLPG